MRIPAAVHLSQGGVGQYTRQLPAYIVGWSHLIIHYERAVCGTRGKTCYGSVYVLQDWLGDGIDGTPAGHVFPFAPLRDTWKPISVVHLFWESGCVAYLRPNGMTGIDKASYVWMLPTH